MRWSDDLKTTAGLNWYKVKRLSQAREIERGLYPKMGRKRLGETNSNIGLEFSKIFKQIISQFVLVSM